jgi:2,3-dihydroxybenzoate decarboxylase
MKPQVTFPRTSLLDIEPDHAVHALDQPSGHGLSDRGATRPLLRKIALEEVASSSVFDATGTTMIVPGSTDREGDLERGSDIERRLTDIELRLKSMDSADVACTVVSLTVPHIENISDAQQAIDAARRVNDDTRAVYTGGQHANRFRAFGCVAMRDGMAAAVEAERCVKELGFVGILINGYAHVGDANPVRYLDEPQYEPFWAKLAELDVPLYLHPRVPPPERQRICQKYEFLTGSRWGFHADTALQAVRLMVSGLFDRHPQLKFILGRCGAGLPYYVSRLDPQLRHGLNTYDQPLRTYMGNNFWVTTAGTMSEGALEDTLRIFGANRVMWGASSDSYGTHGGSFDHLGMDEQATAKIGWDNARRLLKL